ncbi:membrane-associated guanylate kinase, WW and PDZ domain-containing protein 1-like [Scyliorhinus canicula]|uniref:membrane-associated guanylate kinase, WW and PDZ domain-containing protein 1-like n=1 Tax=Scyliorhinus canicula TaxID=7830 RepID=UPI0018F5FBBB|nr:membrane-associated guanylate kinase, WW and PDZ domain-containing protein 1-like [Scyliorhinus canicula]
MFRKLLSITHWTQRTREVTLCRDEQGALNFRLLGGAEYGQFLFIADPQGGKARHLPGKLQAGDLLLEVNDTPVSGLTLRDTLGLLANLPDPVRVKTAPQGSQLNSDLRHFLKQVFSKGSADFELQDRIRQNLYIRVVPCTTRAPRDGEIPGVDYHFITLSEFQALERAGGLLESGKFDGNYYGTPVPPILPTDTNLILEPSMLRHSSRSKSFINLERGSGREEGPGSSVGEPQEPAMHPGLTAATSNGHLTGSTSNQITAPAGNGLTGLMEGSVERKITTNAKDKSKPNISTRETQCIEYVSYDVIVAIDKASVLGYTHGQVVRVFQAIPEGVGAELHLQRGYQPLYNVEPHLLAEVNARVASIPPAPDVALLPVAVMQSASGPGFTVARGTGGYARVMAISDCRCCPDLREGDLIAKVNGQRVRTLSDQQLDEVLQTHIQAGDVILLVQRAVDIPLTGTQHSPNSTKSLANGSAQPLAGNTDRASGHQDGAPPFAVSGVQQDREAPCSEGQEKAEGGQTQVDVRPQWQDEGSGVLAVASENAFRNETSPASAFIPLKGSHPGNSSLPARHEASQVVDRRPMPDGRSQPVKDKGGSSWRSQFSTRECNGTSGKSDSREGDRRSLSLSASRDIPGVSSRLKLSSYQPDQSLSLCHSHPCKGSELYTVDLKRSPTGFGFSVRGGCEYDMDLYIMGLIVGGPAMTSGKIRIGDQIVEINDERTQGMTHSGAVHLIKQEQENIRLVLRSGNGHVPEYGPNVAGVVELTGVTLLPHRRLSTSQIPRGRSESLSRETQGSLEPESHYAAALLSEPAHPGMMGELAEVIEVKARGSRASRTWKEYLGSQPNTKKPRGGNRLGKGQYDEKRPEALRDPGSQTVHDHARPQALHDHTRPQALHDHTEPQAFVITVPQAFHDHTRPQALLDHTKPQALHNHNRTQALHDHIKSQALSDHTRLQAIPDTGQQGEESSETDWEDEETDSGDGETDSGDGETNLSNREASPSQQSLSSGNFDEQRQMSSMIGTGLDFAGGALQSGRRAADEKYCTQCGSRRVCEVRRRRRLRGILAPGPWLVPGRGKLLEIIDR